MSRAVRLPTLWIGLCIAGGVLLRAWRLEWQPLWWDEGYSIYFATEPLLRMLWLTARDIHPPLYYALLHTWFNLIGDTGVVSARWLSVLMAAVGLPLVAWAAHVAFPQRRWLPVWAVLLLAVNPFHIYYSQEVRMYGLAMALSLASTGAFLRILAAQRAGQAVQRPLILYVLTATFSLWTLYYTGLLLLAHQLIALWTYRRDWTRLRWFLLAALSIAILQAPWWLYSLPKLLTYVADKVVADQDAALGLPHFLWRHLSALAAGHIRPVDGWQAAVHAYGPLLVFALPGLLAVVYAFGSLREDERRSLYALTGSLAIPIIVAFLVSLRLPFFPVGGERLLLFVLPYLLLLLAFALDVLIARPWLLTLTWLCILAPSSAGVLTFYTTPRYVEDDYRPIIRYVTQHGSDHDTLVALFPWQVGYWRAYSPRADDGDYLSPQPAPVDQAALVWSATMATQLDAALNRGIVWFPAPLSFGSTLPGQVEAHLAAHAANVENRWFGSATRLSAWAGQPMTLAPVSTDVDFGLVKLVSASLGPTTVRAANEPVFLDLVWRAAESLENLRVTIRVLDERDHIWAQRDLAPLGGYPATTPQAGEWRDRAAIQIPVGTPPGAYWIAVGVGEVGEERLFPTRDGDYLGLLILASLTVEEPSQPLAPPRLPASVLLAAPSEVDGVRLVGYDAPGALHPVMAGTPVNLTLFVQATMARPPARDLSLALMGPDGTQRAVWKGWPLPDYPTEEWPRGALVTLPMALDLPSDISSGPYRLQVGLAQEPNEGVTALTKIAVFRRAASFTAQQPRHPLDVPVQFGTHVRLMGYDLDVHPDKLDLALHWEVLQSLLPEHHIFAHLYDADGVRAAQQDGPPNTTTGVAPTGSWLPGERLTTVHTIDLRAIPPSDYRGWTIQVGLYRPRDETRLPTTIAGSATGDAAILPLP